MKAWIIEGKYTTGPESAWEEVDTVDETDTGGPDNTLTGHAYAVWLTDEYRTAHHPNPVRLRSKRSTD